MTTFTNHYQTLDVSVKATPCEIRASYRRLALTQHPDKAPDNPNATAIFQRIQAAYEILIDATKRELYDVLRKRQADSPANETAPFESRNGTSKRARKEDRQQGRKPSSGSDSKANGKSKSKRKNKAPDFDMEPETREAPPCSWEPEVETLRQHAKQYRNTMFSVDELLELLLQDFLLLLFPECEKKIPHRFRTSKSPIVVESFRLVGFAKEAAKATERMGDVWAQQKKRELEEKFKQLDLSRTYGIPQETDAMFLKWNTRVEENHLLSPQTLIALMRAYVMGIGGMPNGSLYTERKAERIRMGRDLEALVDRFKREGSAQATEHVRLIC